MTQSLAKSVFEKTVKLCNQAADDYFNEIIEQIESKSNSGWSSLIYKTSTMITDGILDVLNKKLLDNGFLVEFTKKFQDYAQDELLFVVTITIEWNENGTSVGKQMHQNTLKQIELETIKNYNRIIDEISKASDMFLFSIRTGTYSSPTCDSKKLIKMLRDDHFKVEIDKTYDDEDDEYSFEVSWDFE